ncbi:MAG: hypothetical protein DI560_19865 [Pseudomonas putida]|nr:MAG: hypothetical protein DI560_19865 [Pseudomonas putida]
MATLFFSRLATSGRQFAGLVVMLLAHNLQQADAHHLLLQRSLSGIKQRSFLGARPVASADPVDKTSRITAPGAKD